MVAIVNAFVALLAAGAAVAVPVSTRDGACTTKTQRKAWSVKGFLPYQGCIQERTSY